jgi:hypothetical protein
MQPKPNLVNVIAWTTLASGVVNLIWGIGLSITVLMSIIGIICVPLTILPTILGIFEILYAAKLLSNPPQPVQPSPTIAILEIACLLAGNIFALVVGILSLVFYNDQVVKDYFARLNSGSLPPSSVPPVSPPPPAPSAPDVPPVDVAPAPPVEPEMDSVEPPPSPDNDENPKG